MGFPGGTVLTAALLVLFAFSVTESSRGRDGNAENDIERSSLQRWGYCLWESVEKKPQRKRVESALGGLHTLSITGYKLDRDGRLHGPSARIREEIATLAGKSGSGVEMLPLVTFSSSSAGRTLLASTAARKSAVAELAALARNGVYSGLHLDFEYLPPEDAPLLAAFLGELRSGMNGGRLTMAVFPPVDFPAKWAGFHNLDLIGPLLDEIVLMCYDYHRPGTPPGPVVDLDWASRNISQVLKTIQPERVWLGMPAYGYDWPENGKPKVVPAREGVRSAEKHNAIRHASGTLFFRYSDRNGIRNVYLADMETRRRMEALARSRNLKGAALWRLGFEE